MSLEFVSAKVVESSRKSKSRTIVRKDLVCVFELDGQEVTSKADSVSECGNRPVLSGYLRLSYGPDGEPQDGWAIALEDRPELVALIEKWKPGKIAEVSNRIERKLNPPKAVVLDGEGPIRFSLEGEVYEIEYKANHDAIGEVVAERLQISGEPYLRIFKLHYADGKGQTDVSIWPAKISQGADGVWRVVSHDAKSGI